VGFVAAERAGAVRFPRRAAVRPVRAIGQRVGLALLLVLLNWAIVLVEHDGYRDSYDGSVSIVDALYYTTVTLTTTGYGDITPVTTGARLVNALVVTPMRLLFVILLVGTTISALTQRSREEFRLARWRARMGKHIVVLGFGTKGRNAVRALVLKGVPRERIVVIDRDQGHAADAGTAGHVAVCGSATSEAVLREALVERAGEVIVALDRDDTAILATLVTKRLNPRATVIASVREAENARLLEQSGADSVIVSSETAGRLLGLATDSPETVEIVEDLLSFGQGFDLAERPVATNEVGQSPNALGIPVLAVIRAGRTYRYSETAVATLFAGDRVIYAST
jgi:voltage-gated potassium channel